MSPTSPCSVARRSGANRRWWSTILLIPETPPGGQGLDRSGRHSIHANILRPEIVGQITHRRLKRCLGYPHDIVVWDDSFTSKIGQGDRRIHPPSSTAQLLV